MQKSSRGNCIRILILVLYTYRNRIVITLCLDRFSVFHRAVKMVEKEKAPSKEIPIDPLQHKSSLTSVDDIEENNVCVRRKLDPNGLFDPWTIAKHRCFSTGLGAKHNSLFYSPQCCEILKKTTKVSLQCLGVLLCSSCMILEYQTVFEGALVTIFAFLQNRAIFISS